VTLTPPGQKSYDTATVVYRTLFQCTASRSKRQLQAGLAEEGSRRKRRFSEEFRREAVRWVAEEKYSFNAAAVGVSEQSLRAWHAKFVPAPPPCGEGATLEELKAENTRLRKQLKRAELEREILKEATAPFC